MKLYQQGRLGTLREENVRFHFFPENWREFFQNTGWSVKEMRYLNEEGRKLGRNPPTPLLYRILLHFAPEARREQVKQMTGYAMLSR